MCLSACACACVCLRACERVCVRASFPPPCGIFPGTRLAPRTPSNHVGDKSEAVTSVLSGARARTQACGRLHPSYTHTHTTQSRCTHGSSPETVQSNWFPCAFTGMYLQPHWAPCAFTGPVRDTPTIPLVSLCFHRDVPATPLGTLFTGPVRDTPTIPLVSLCFHRDPPTLPRGSLCLHRKFLTQDPIANPS
jgi:hypothetical protein